MNDLRVENSATVCYQVLITGIRGLDEKQISVLIVWIKGKSVRKGTIREILSKNYEFLLNMVIWYDILFAISKISKKNANQNHVSWSNIGFVISIDDAKDIARYGCLTCIPKKGRIIRKNNLMKLMKQINHNHLKNLLQSNVVDMAIISLETKFKN
ncbi:hypothetical protein LXL04_002134 [Taraxacum kok-saghyz]